MTRITLLVVAICACFWLATPEPDQNAGFVGEAQPTIIRPSFVLDEGRIRIEPIESSPYAEQDDPSDSNTSRTGWTGQVVDSTGRPLRLSTQVHFFAQLVAADELPNPPAKLDDPDPTHSQEHAHDHKIRAVPWDAWTATNAEGWFRLEFTEDALRRIEGKIGLPLNGRLEFRGHRDSTRGTESRRELLYGVMEVPVRRGEVTSLGQIVLPFEGADVYGYVRDHEGKPVAQAEIYVDFAAGRLSGVKTQTNPDGWYALRGIDRLIPDEKQDVPLRVGVHFIRDRFPFSVVEPVPSQEVSGRAGGRVDFVVHHELKKATAWAGIRLSNHGRTVARASWRVVDAQGTRVAGAVVPLARGEVFIPGPIPRPTANAKAPGYRLEVLSNESLGGGFASIPLTATDDGLRAELHPADWTVGNRVIAVVRDADGRLFNGTLYLCRPVRNQLMPDREANALNGDVEFAMVAPGTYELAALRNQEYRVLDGPEIHVKASEPLWTSARRSTVR